MTPHQEKVKAQITALAMIYELPISWPLAIAEQESGLGENQLSPTGAKGVFQMTRIAMFDLLQEMVRRDDDWIDISCGLLFLRLLLKRHGSIEAATAKYCDPKDRSFYVPAVLEKIKKYEYGGKTDGSV